MQPSTADLAVILPLSIVALDSLRRFIEIKRERKGLPLPPGPTQIPLLGNAHSINLDEPWRTYTDWHAKYGDVLYTRILDQDIIVLGSQEMAINLLEKRSRLYSDRPFIASVGPFGADCHFIFSSYGDEWRFCRRIFNQSYRSKAAVNFRPMQLHYARQIVVNIADNPDSYLAHYSTFAVAVVVSATYGYDPSPQHDPIVQIIEDYTTATAPSVTPEKSVLIKLFPFLLHIPDWFPGSSLKRQANYAYDLSRKITEVPYQYAEEKFKTSFESSTFSMVSDNLARMQEKDASQHAEYVAALKKAAISAVLASAEATSSSLMTFTLAMVLHPHVWKRAQAEIDAVVGTDRLPDFGDRPALPYVDAIIRETARWHPVVPMGIWHSTSDSDVYDGYYIPKGATVVANIWAMSRDEIRFPNAEAFLPGRFLDETGMLNDNDPSEFTFGFGRRICPGRYTADASLWSSIATMLATLDFYPAKDEEGKDISFEPEWINGVTHRPAVFPSQLSLRAHLDKSHVERMLAN